MARQKNFKYPILCKLLCYDIKWYFLKSLGHIFIIAWHNASDGSFSYRYTMNGCSVGTKVLHRHCICHPANNITTHESEWGVFCETLCTKDRGCKGYALQNTLFPNNQRLRYCRLSTASACPAECNGPFSTGNVKPLDPTATSGSCFIKETGNIRSWSFYFDYQPFI